MADLAVAVIHGMGSQSPDFAEPTIDEISGIVGAECITRPSPNE
ncbi:MAG: hypothetical protein O7A98_09425 [Acidobacteria bacterium]|nr:hypothetical protein [Acidobacteriota bacterium]